MDNVSSLREVNSPRFSPISNPSAHRKDLSTRSVNRVAISSISYEASPTLSLYSSSFSSPLISTRSLMTSKRFLLSSSSSLCNTRLEEPSSRAMTRCWALSLSSRTPSFMSSRDTLVPSSNTPSLMMLSISSAMTLAKLSTLCTCCIEIPSRVAVSL